MGDEGIILDDVPPGFVRMVVAEGKSIPEWPYFVESDRQINATCAMGGQVVHVGASFWGASGVKGKDHAGY